MLLNKRKHEFYNNFTRNIKYVLQPVLKQHFIMIGGEYKWFQTSSRRKKKIILFYLVIYFKITWEALSFQHYCQKIQAIILLTKSC